ncbi:MAG: hypothetical protein ACOCX1_04495 [Fimbriimonadaceae bacterium]
MLTSIALYVAASATTEAPSLRVSEGVNLSTVAETLLHSSLKDNELSPDWWYRQTPNPQQPFLWLPAPLETFVGHAMLYRDERGDFTYHGGVKLRFPENQVKLLESEPLRLTPAK